LTHESDAVKAGKNTRFAFAILALALLFVFATQAGRMLVVNAPEHSDVILVLAGETDRRPTRALELLDQGYGKLVVIDVPSAAMIYKYSQVQLAEQYARSLPQASSIRICPIVGLSTRDESHDAKKCLTRVDSPRILIVTSDYHTRRALSVFRHELRGRTFSVAAAYDPSEFGTRWWKNRQWAKTCFYEWLRQIWWNAVDRWR
jgi:DUF218 domain